MTEKKKGKSWAEMTAGEKKAVLVGWAVIIVVGGYFLLPSTKDESPQAPVPVATSSAPAATYTQPGAEALAAAEQYLAGLDRAMADSIAVLKAGELQGQHDQSKRFGVLVDKGAALFGATIFEPLGHCFGAGNYARSWWHAQLAAASNGGTESAPGWIQSALDDYQMHRAECLKSADPVASEKAEAELDASLREKLGGGRECLTTYDLDANTKQVVALPKPAHCKI